MSKPLVAILGSCRQESIGRLYPVTSWQELITYPHYTKEMIQELEYITTENGGIVAGYNPVTKKQDKPDESSHCFRKGLIYRRVIPWQKTFQNEFEQAKVFVLEVASRLKYQFANGLYAHHVAYDKEPFLYDKKNITRNEQSDEEILEDLDKLKQKIAPRPMIIVSHICTYEGGKRYELKCLIKKWCENNKIILIDPSILLKKHSISELFLPEIPITHFTALGHNEMLRLYDEAIQTALKNSV